MGGIIALGLGTKNWSVGQSTYEFQKICREAFAPRDFIRIPVFQRIATLNYGGKYKTKPFQTALKRSFQDDQLFGGASTEQKYRRKVAVVSATDFGRVAVVLSNYNRLEPHTGQGIYFTLVRHTLLTIVQSISLKDPRVHLRNLKSGKRK
jgi:hypothetical protein